MEEYLLLGFITDSFGLDGTVKVLSKTQFGEKRYKKGNVVFLYNEKEGTDYVARIFKGQSSAVSPSQTGSSVPSALKSDKDGKTIIVFSGDMDKVMASFIIANGAAAMGKPVTMFFTFWGLSVLRKAGHSKVDKTPMEKMFGAASKI